MVYFVDIEYIFFIEGYCLEIEPESPNDEMYNCED